MGSVGNEFLLQPIAAHQPGVGVIGEHPDAVRAQHERFPDSPERAVARDQSPLQGTFAPHAVWNSLIDGFGNHSLEREAMPACARVGMCSTPDESGHSLAEMPRAQNYIAEEAAT